MARSSVVLVISQVFPPDPAAVGQYLAEVAERLGQRGSEVVVLTARHGYDDPSLRYSTREQVGQVTVRRMGWSNFGKKRLAARIGAGVIYLGQVLIYGFLMPRIDSILVSTVPPLAAVPAAIIARLKGARLVYWVMDLNPDQVAALGMARRSSLVYRVLHRLNRWSFERADTLLVLDEFINGRISRDYGIDKGRVIPLWPLEQGLQVQERLENDYRREHGVGPNQILVMYAGNHSPHAPMTALIDAAARVRHDDCLVFWFVGGGAGKHEIERRVEEEGLNNVKCLPYQPLERLGSLLSAADVHVVTLRAETVGINHPSKIYGVMGAGKPVLYLGPQHSHVSQILEKHTIGWRVDREDAAAIDEILGALAAMPRKRLDEIGRRARQITEREFNRDVLLRRVVAEVEGLERG